MSGSQILILVLAIYCLCFIGAYFIIKLAMSKDNDPLTGWEAFAFCLFGPIWIIIAVPAQIIDQIKDAKKTKKT